jgi:gluconate 2-dehydrogenase gamma chain
MFDTITLNRRSMMERVTYLIGASAAVGIGDLAHAQKPVPGAKHFLAPADFALLGAVADTIVPRTDTPGALDAEVPQKFDSLLGRWASPERRATLTASLRKIDAVARSERQQNFAALPAADRLALMIKVDAAALKTVPVAPKPDVAKIGAVEATVDPQTGKTKQAPIHEVSLGPPVADAAYAKLKELIVVLYYYSEPALTTELSYVHNPGRWQPSIPVTADTRPVGGLGLF